MEETAKVPVASAEGVDYETAIDECLAAMRQMEEKMTDRQRRIEKLQAETQARLAQLKVA